jgi:hypothetical protein
MLASSTRHTSKGVSGNTPEAKDPPPLTQMCFGNPRKRRRLARARRSPHEAYCHTERPLYRLASAGVHLQPGPQGRDRRKCSPRNGWGLRRKDLRVRRERSGPER